MNGGCDAARKMTVVAAKKKRNRVQGVGYGVDTSYVEVKASKRDVRAILYWRLVVGSDC